MIVPLLLAVPLRNLINLLRHPCSFKNDDSKKSDPRKNISIYSKIVLVVEISIGSGFEEKLASNYYMDWLKNQSNDLIVN